MRPERVQLLILGLTALLYLPALSLGFVADFYWLPSLAGGAPAGAAPYDVRFADETARAWWLAHGLVRWWSTDEFQWVLLRPLSTALLRAQWALFGNQAFGWHALSLALYLGLVAIAGALYRRLLAPAPALLALFAFALHSSHPQSVWLYSDQHAVISVGAGLGGFLAHLRWLEDGWAPGRLVSPLLFVVGLSAGETTLATLPLWVAWDRRTALPVVAIAVVYVLVHALAGYTSRDSLIFVDPADGALTFLGEAFRRVPALVAGSFGVFPADLWLFRPELRRLQAVLALVVTVHVFVLAPRQRITRVLAAAGAMSLLPVAASPPGGRLLLVSSFCAAGLVATVLTEAWRRHARLYWIGAAPLGLVTMVAPLLIVPAILLGYVRGLDEMGVVAAETAEVPPDAEDCVVLTLPGTDFGMNFLSIQHILHARPFPTSWTVLSAARHDQSFRRTAADTLELVVHGGRLLDEGGERIFRPRPWPLRPGDELDQAGVHATILAVDEVGPTHVAFRFPRALDDPRYAVLAWVDSRLRRVELPPVGGSLRIPTSPGGW